MLRNFFAKIHKNFFLVWFISLSLFISSITAIFFGERKAYVFDQVILFMFLFTSFVQYAKWKGEKDAKPIIEAEFYTERDELYDKAKELTIELGRGSITHLQRKLQIGYKR